MLFLDNYGYSFNQKRLLAMIFSGRAQTRQRLAALSGLSTLTVTKSVASFLENGILIESGKLDSTGGRKANMLHIRSDLAYVICADIGASATRIGLVSVGGAVVYKEEFSYYEGTFPTTAMPVDMLKKKLLAVYREHSQYSILGIHICISGLVDSRAGRIIFCPNIHGYDGMAIVEYLKRDFDVPVYLDTSARTMALAEQYYGAGRGVENQIFISVGFSISAGIIINGGLFRGTGGFAGEVGHIFVGDKGEVCTCGNHGCLEIHATLPVILNNFRDRIQNNTMFSLAKGFCEDPAHPTVREMQLALQKGDKLAFGILAEAGESLGKISTDLANILNPQMIILGGGAIENFGMLVDEVERVVRSQALSTNQDQLEIKKGATGFDSALIGGPIEIFQSYLVK